MLISSRIRGVAAITLASVLWGTTGTAASFTPNVSPLTTGAFAMGVAALLLFCVSLKQLQQDSEVLRQHIWLLCAGTLAVAVYPLAFYSAMRLSGVAVGSLVSLGAAPLFAALFERLTGKHRLSIRWLLSVVLGIAGVSLLVTAKQQNYHSADDTMLLVFCLVLSRQPVAPVIPLSPLSWWQRGVPHALQ